MNPMLVQAQEIVGQLFRTGTGVPQDQEWALRAFYVVDHPQIDIRREPFLAVGLGAHRVEGILHVGSR